MRAGRTMGEMVASHLARTLADKSHSDLDRSCEGISCNDGFSSTRPMWLKLAKFGRKITEVKSWNQPSAIVVAASPAQTLVAMNPVAASWMMRKEVRVEYGWPIRTDLERRSSHDRGR